MGLQRLREQMLARSHAKDAVWTTDTSCIFSRFDEEPAGSVRRQMSQELRLLLFAHWRMTRCGTHIGLRDWSQQLLNVQRLLPVFIADQQKRAATESHAISSSAAPAAAAGSASTMLVAPQQPAAAAASVAVTSSAAAAASSTSQPMSTAPAVPRSVDAEQRQRSPPAVHSCYPGVSRAIGCSHIGPPCQI
jgi:hypothetical protein